MTPNRNRSLLAFINTLESAGKNTRGSQQVSLCQFYGAISVELVGARNNLCNFPLYFKLAFVSNHWSKTGVVTISKAEYDIEVSCKLSARRRINSLLAGHKKGA
jgi:hypothetical protein